MHASMAYNQQPSQMQIPIDCDGIANQVVQQIIPIITENFKIVTDNQPYLSNAFADITSNQELLAKGLAGLNAFF